MAFDFTPLAAISGIAALVSAALGIVAWNQRDMPCVRSFSSLAAFITIWTLGAMVELSTTSLANKILWSKIEYIGTLSVPVLFMLLAADYNRIESLKKPKVLVWLFAVPVVCLVLAATNEWHSLIWTFYHPSPSGFNLLVYGHGPVFWIGVAGYSYLNMFLGSLLLVRALHYYPRHYRGQSMVLMVASVIPWLGNLLYLTGQSPLQGLDLTPLCFALTGMVFAFDILYLRLLNIVPIARDRAFESMGDGIIVIDEHRMILDINLAARGFLGDANRKWVGEVLAHPAIVRALSETAIDNEVVLEQAERLILDIRTFPVFENGDQARALMLVLRDVTARKASDDALKKANSMLQLRLSEIETLQSALYDQAYKDPLTGLFNRRYLAEVFPELLKQCREKEHVLSIAILDIDHFKAINDQHGHHIGDQVLCSLAEWLLRHAMPYESVFRLGGEEFLVLMPYTHADEAVGKVDQLREQFYSIEHQGSDGPFQVTFSSGLAAYPAHGDSEDGLYQIADVALYRAKREGRNQVQLAG